MKKNNPELIKEANSPNGWIYVLDKEYDRKEKVPPEFIKAAWNANGKGQIVGEFMSNLSYSGNVK